MGELKPCPFCGGKALGPTDAWPHMITCEQCGASVKGFGYAEDGEQEAIEKWNKRTAETPSSPEKEIICAMCGDTFTEADLNEFLDMGEGYLQEKGLFLCPDCWDSFQKMDPEDRVKMAVNNGWEAAHHES